MKKFKKRLPLKVCKLISNLTLEMNYYRQNASIFLTHCQKQENFINSQKFLFGFTLFGHRFNFYCIHERLCK